MESDRLNQWLSLGANFGVIIGLALLIVELNQTNRISEYSAEIARRNQAMDINSSRIEHSETYAKLQEGGLELSPSEQVQALMMARQLYNYWSNAETAYERGLLSDSSFDGVLNDISVSLKEAPGLIPYFAYLQDANRKEDDDSIVADRIAEIVSRVEN